MTDWNIQSRAHACQACGRRFADKESYHTLLFDEKAALHRIDVCQECWQKEYSDARDRKGFISHWQGVYEAPPPPAPEPIQKENAESLLRKIIALNDPHYGPAAFILAVMLERKRLLKVKEQVVREGRRVFIYEHPKSGDVFMVMDPDLQLNQLATVQHDVAGLLEHGLPTPESQTVAAVPAEVPAGQTTEPTVPGAESPTAEAGTEPAPAAETGAESAPAAEAGTEPAPAAEAGTEPAPTPEPDESKDSGAAEQPASQP